MIFLDVSSLDKHPTGLLVGYGRPFFCGGSTSVRHTSFPVYFRFEHHGRHRDYAGMLVVIGTYCFDLYHTHEIINRATHRPTLMLRHPWSSAAAAHWRIQHRSPLESFSLFHCTQHILPFPAVSQSLHHIEEECFVPSPVTYFLAQNFAIAIEPIAALRPYRTRSAPRIERYTASGWKNWLKIKSRRTLLRASSVAEFSSDPERLSSNVVTASHQKISAAEELDWRTLVFSLSHSQGLAEISVHSEASLSSPPEVLGVALDSELCSSTACRPASVHRESLHSTERCCMYWNPAVTQTIREMKHRLCHN
nr:hypothetical protein CFP56_71337 [Quercus suber]